MKNCKKAISILLAMLMVLSPLTGSMAYAENPYEASVTSGSTTQYYESFEVAASPEHWFEGSTLNLLGDIDTTQSVLVENGAHTLNLNGFGLRAASDTNFSVITVSATAELTVVNTDNTEHRYTVDSNLLATVNDDATGTEGEDYFTFTGGYITGGKGTSDKGGAVLNNGTFTMTGGNIIGNTALRGGGVYNAGTVNFAGGQILYNYAPGWGGGIYLAEQPANIANVSGGTIAYNLSGNGGGIHVTDGDTLNLSGSPTVLNNMATDNTDNNINVALDGKMAVTGKIENSASIGVRRSQIYGILTESENTDYNDPANFVSDVPNCVIGKDVTTGQLKLHAPYTVTWLNENGDVLETDTGLAEGTMPTYDGDTPVKPNDPQSLYLFDSWSPEITVASGDATYTATYREVTPVAKVGDTLFGDIETAVRAENWSEGSTLTLLANIDTVATVTVPDGAHTLDLNGCGLRATGNSDFSVITVPANAELTVVNSTDTKHKYTADSNFLATVNDNATGVEGEDYFTFNGGYITGGKGNSSCGGGINISGTLNFTAGTIIGNSANKGAGICNYGVSNISGGQIIYNYANGWGGGIYLSDTVANTVNLTGGLIENNNANNGGGIHVSRNDKVNLSGSPVVLNNYSTGNKKNNINLTENAVICITGELGSAATIGIKRSDQAGIITDSENTDYNNAQRFISDSADYVVGKDVATSQLKLHAPYTVTWLNENGDLLETDTGLAEGTVPTYDGETPIKPGDEEHFYTFDGWSPEVAPISSNTTYTATFVQTSGVAKVNDVFYSTFEQAVEAAEQIEGGAAITLLADIDEPYTLSPTQILRVILNGHQFNPNAPEGAYRLEETAQGDETVYSVVKLYARVGNTDYESFAEAAEASGGTENITLLRDMDEPYNIQTLLCADMLSVKADGHTANITNYARTQTRQNVSDYFKTDKEVYVDGEGIDAEDVIVIAAGTAATVVVVEGGEASVVIGTGASVILDAGEGANVDLEPENPDEECLQEEEHEDGSREIKNLKYHVVTIDTGISILDVGAEALPDCVNDMYQTYQQNISSIIKITPPVLSIIGYTDVIIKFPYPEGWFFPPIPYLPEAMNPGSHFIAFFEGTTPTSYGTPFIGKYITEDLDITGIWVPYEAAIEKPNGELEYYLSFCDAAADADGNVVRILSAPLGTYTLKKTHESPVIYETLKVKRGHYKGTCVAAPENLPKGYKMRTWTYKDDDDETVTCYTIDGSIQPNNGVCLTIGSDITSNYYIDCSAYDGATKLVYTYNSVNEKEEYVPVTKEIDLNNIPSELISGNRVKLTVSQAAAQMAEATHIELQNSYGEVLDTLDYSAKTYCDNVTGMSDDALSEYTGSVASAKKLKTLCYSLLAYAKAAQGVFSEYDTTTVVCDNEQVNEQIEDATFEPNYVLDNTGMIKFSTVSFACTKDARLRVYLNTSGATYTPPAPVSNYGKAVLKYRIKDGVKEYFVEVGGIDAADFSKQMTISYGGSQITLSVLDYAGIVLKNSKATQAQKQLAKALIVYNENAQAYFG